MEIDKRIFDKYNIKMEEIAPKIIDAKIEIKKIYSKYFINDYND